MLDQFCGCVAAWTVWQSWFFTPERGGRNPKGGPSGHNGPSVREALDGTPGSSLHADGIGKDSLPFLHCGNCGWTLTEDAVNSPSWQRLLEKWT